MKAYNCCNLNKTKLPHRFLFFFFSNSNWKDTTPSDLQDTPTTLRFIYNLVINQLSYVPILHLAMLFILQGY